MFGALDISTSALVAHRTHLNIISQNLAKQDVTHDADGNFNPYRRRIAIFAEGDPATGRSEGVHVREIKLDDAPFNERYVGVGHPNADERGYMKTPNVHPAVEMVDALAVSRAYEANITAIEATKSMANAALQLLA